MSILIDENTKVLIQGMTGKQGQKAAKGMIAYGTEVLCGVTPGKAGEEVEGKPIYNTVSDALTQHPDVNLSLISVPPFAVKGAVFEAIDAGIMLIDILTEKVPILDSAKIYAYAKKKGVRVVGPSSVGIISPGKAKVGAIGGLNPDRVYVPGNIGVISKSGGMCSETSWLLKQHGMGQSTVIGIGGDMIMGSTFTDLLELFEKDEDTHAVVMFGELGGTYEEQVAKMVEDGKFTKPIAAFIGGKFSETLPSSVKLGHAGALIEGKMGTPQGKIEALEKAGVMVAKAHHELPLLIKGVL